MMILETLYSSNLVQLAATFASGVGLAAVVHRYPRVLSFLSYMIGFGIFFSFFFNMGEVYQYTPYYKRAFFIYGDSITTVLVVLFCYAVLSGKEALSYVTAASVLMSGGKISIALLFIFVFVLVKINGNRMRDGVIHFLKYVAVGILIYSGGLFLPGFFGDIGFTKLMRPAETVVKTAMSWRHHDDKSAEEEHISKVQGAGACENLSVAGCLAKQLRISGLQRYYSSLAGLWMTLEGGLPGPAYPATAKKFADLMMQKNPWGINDKYKLTYEDWLRMRAPQNPYLRFGSGYGPWLLGALLTGFLVVGGIAVANLAKGERGPGTVFTAFFIVNVTLNQTQSWLTSGSPILALLGFSFFHIGRTWLRTKQLTGTDVEPYEQASFQTAIVDARDS
jgi:hypothetical protein